MTTIILPLLADGPRAKLPSWLSILLQAATCVSEVAIQAITTMLLSNPRKRGRILGDKFIESIH